MLKSKKVLIILWLIVCALLGFYLPKIPIVQNLAYELIGIKEVNIVSDTNIPERDIKEALKGQTWLFFDEKKLKEILKIKFSFIKDIEVIKNDWGKLTIKIVRRTPFALISFKGKKLLIDENGNFLDEKYYPDLKKDNVVYIIYNDIDIDSSKLEKVKKLKERFSRKFKIKKYIIYKSQISCVLDSGKSLVFSTEDFDRNLKKAEKFLEKQSIEGFSYINFSFNSMVVVRR